MAGNGLEIPYEPRNPVLKYSFQMGVQPTDLISTLPQIHEQTISPLDALSPSSTSYSFATPSASPAFSSTVVIAEEKEKSYSIAWQAVEVVGHFIRLRTDSQTLQRNHYKPVQSAVKCAAPNCRRRFGMSVWKRNCCMCGEVFCRKCTNFQRKLSQGAEPDPLGALHPVCEKCFHFVAQSGHFRDLLHEYQKCRERVQREKTERKKKDSMDVAKPVERRDSSESKISLIQSEIERLCYGFQTESFYNLKDLVMIPTWHKSNRWVSDMKQSDCFECKKPLRMTSRKTNCRVCGQVFCTTCTKNEILLYCHKDGLARWAINGKEGGPSTKPSRFETLPICNHCCQELESILVTELQGPTPAKKEEEYDFLGEAVTLQRELMALQTRIERHLTHYQKMVDSMDFEDSSPHSTGTMHPLYEVAKAQADLSDTFFVMANKSQALKKLKPGTETQGKLAKYLMTATFAFYSEHMVKFRSAQVRLKEMIPLESLSVIQGFLDQQSMERVHFLLQQILHELLNLQSQFKFINDSFLVHLVKVNTRVEEEFKPFLTRQGEDWDKHVKNVQVLIKKEIVEHPRIKIITPLPQNRSQAEEYVRYLVLSCATVLISECSRELEDKTREELFTKTKASLESLQKQFDAELKLIATHP